MTDFGSGLLERTSQHFNFLVKTDRKLKRLASRIRDGTSYYDAQDYAVRLGELLSQALNETTDGLAFLSREVAQELLEPLLTQDHEMISAVVEQVQKNMNKANGLRLNAMTPDLDTDRINGLIGKVASGETLEETRWVFGEPVINYSQAVVDKGIEKNARATSKIGLKAYIIREAEASGTRTIKRGNKSYRYSIPCRWCRDLAGKYDYEDVRGTGNDVYRRHRSCRCRVTYENGTDRQDVWSKAEWTETQADQSREIIEKAIEQQKTAKENERKRKAQRRSNVSRVISELGYSPKGASIWMNVNKKYIDRYGLDYMIDQQRNLDYRNGVRRHR